MGSTSAVGSGSGSTGMETVGMGLQSAGSLYISMVLVGITPVGLGVVSPGSGSTGMALAINAG